MCTNDAYGAQVRLCSVAMMRTYFLNFSCKRKQIQVRHTLSNIIIMNNSNIHMQHRKRDDVRGDGVEDVVFHRVTVKRVLQQRHQTAIVTFTHVASTLHAARHLLAAFAFAFVIVVVTAVLIAHFATVRQVAQQFHQLRTQNASCENDVRNDFVNMYCVKYSTS